MAVIHRLSTDTPINVLDGVVTMTETLGPGGKARAGAASPWETIT